MNPIPPGIESPLSLIADPAGMAGHAITAAIFALFNHSIQ